MPGAPHIRGLTGFVFAARSSCRQPARLLTRDGCEELVVEIQDVERAVLGSALLSEVRVDPPLGTAPRKLTLPDGTVFETENHDGIEALTGQTSGSLLHHYEGFNARLIGVVAICLSAAWVLWRFGLDIMASVAIAFTPPLVIEQIDAGSLQTIDFTIAEPSKLTAEQRDDVERIYRQLVRSLPDEVQSRHSFDLLFRDMPGMGANAFAMPGGTIVMTDVFVEQFSQPDMLAGVLGHEIGHVVEEHGLKRLYRSLSLYMLIAFLAGDTGPILEDVILEGNLLLSLSFSREQESAADQFGLTLAKKAGFNPGGLKMFFRTMGDKYSDREPAQWMSTHPNNKERLKAIDAFIDEL